MSTNFESFVFSTDLLQHRKAGDIMIKRCKPGNERGGVIVEFALVLPILLILVAGIIEFGFILFNQQIVSSVAREVARDEVIPGNPANINQIVSNWENEVRSFDNNTTLNVVIVNNGNDVTVRVTFEYAFATPNLLQNFGLGFDQTYEINSEVTMRRS